MFTRLDEGESRAVTFTFGTRQIVAREDDTIATALLVAGIETLRRSPVSQSPRGAFCMMGVCFECLVSIDGGPPVQACMAPARDGIHVTGTGSPEETP